MFSGPNQSYFGGNVPAPPKISDWLHNALNGIGQGITSIPTPKPVMASAVTAPMGSGDITGSGGFSNDNSGANAAGFSGSSSGTGSASDGLFYQFANNYGLSKPQADSLLKGLGLSADVSASSPGASGDLGGGIGGSDYSPLSFSSASPQGRAGTVSSGEESLGTLQAGGQGGSAPMGFSIQSPNIPQGYTPTAQDIAQWSQTPDLSGEGQAYGFASGTPQVPTTDLPESMGGPTASSGRVMGISPAMLQSAGLALAGQVVPGLGMAMSAYNLGSGAYDGFNNTMYGPTQTQYAIGDGTGSQNVDNSPGLLHQILNPSNSIGNLLGQGIAGAAQGLGYNGPTIDADPNQPFAPGVAESLAGYGSGPVNTANPLGYDPAAAAANQNPGSYTLSSLFGGGDGGYANSSGYPSTASFGSAGDFLNSFMQGAGFGAGRYGTDPILQGGTFAPGFGAADRAMNPFDTN